MPNAAAVESAQLEPMVRNSSVGAASALVGGGIMVGAVAYENGSLSLDLALWYGLLAVIYAGQVGLAFMLRDRASPPSPRNRLAFSAGSGHPLCCDPQRCHFQTGDRQWRGISG